MTEPKVRYPAQNEILTTLKELIISPLHRVTITNPLSERSLQIALTEVNARSQIGYYNHTLCILGAKVLEEMMLREQWLEDAFQPSSAYMCQSRGYVGHIMRVPIISDWLILDQEAETIKMFEPDIAEFLVLNNNSYYRRRWAKIFQEGIFHEYV